MRLSDEPTSVQARRRELRHLLAGRQIVFPVTAYGLLGFDPNGLGIEDQIVITADLEALGYSRRLRRRPYSHAHTMALWYRDEYWPEDENLAKPYAGIALEPDPDLEDWITE